jgi:DNA repair protein RecO (recombination protein O)
MFLNEVLYKSIRQQMADENLFDFIFSAISWFDECRDENINFHLAFLLKLSRFLGFAPSMQTKSDQSYFDLQEGEFRTQAPSHRNFLDREDAALFILLFNSPFENIYLIKIDNKTRRSILDKILIYYTLHTASFGDIRSHEVLQEILS